MSAQERILVTGAGGFVGGRLVGALNAVGRSTFAWTRSEGDLRDGRLVQKRIEEIAPTTIFHLAAVASREEVPSCALAADEVRMLSNLAFAMPSPCRLIYTGSMAEFGYAGDFDELAACRPTSAYGFAKSSGTQCALALKLSQGFDIRVARLFGVYGPGEGPERLVPHLVSRLLANQPVALSDGSQVRDFVHVDDVCAALMVLADAPDLIPPLVNIGTGIGISVRRVSEIVADLLQAGRDLLRFGAKSRRTVDEDRLVARTDRLRALMRPPPQRWLRPEDVADYVRDLKQRFESGVAGLSARQPGA